MKSYHLSSHLHQATASSHARIMPKLRVFAMAMAMVPVVAVAMVPVVAVAMVIAVLRALGGATHILLKPQQPWSCHGRPIDCHLQLVGGLERHPSEKI